MFGDWAYKTIHCLPKKTWNLYTCTDKSLYRTFTFTRYIDKVIRFVVIIERRSWFGGERLDVRESGEKEIVKHCHPLSLTHLPPLSLSLSLFINPQSLTLLPYSPLSLFFTKFSHLTRFPQYPSWMREWMNWDSGWVRERDKVGLKSEWKGSGLRD